jgi:hypothetical protein
MPSYFSPGAVDELFMRTASVPPEALAEFVASYGTFIVGPPLD